jgi:hypothetical protein
VFFTVMPKESLPTNTAINNQATIVLMRMRRFRPRPVYTIDNDKSTAACSRCPLNHPQTSLYNGRDGSWSSGLHDFCLG